MLKLISIVGARPQFIKMATLSRVLRNYPETQHYILHTGQHYDEGMSDVFFREMDIPEPDRNLGINSLTHGAMTGRMLEGIEAICLQEKPDAVIVYGDTNSTLAGALAARKLHIPLAHVEAGLRSFNMAMPEEINRILTDRISDYLYYPSDTARKNLEMEGFAEFNCEMLFSGDVMYDAALFYSTMSSGKAGISGTVNPDEEFMLCTFHRQENTDDPERLSGLVSAINELAEDRQVVLPLHPRTLKKLEEHRLKIRATVIPPQSYFHMLELLRHCSLVMTDSGGLQKEAYFFQKYCITLRDETEWTELTARGVNLLAGADTEKIMRTVHELSSKEFDADQGMYGDGHAAETIIQHLLNRVQ